MYYAVKSGGLMVSIGRDFETVVYPRQSRQKFKAILTRPTLMNIQLIQMVLHQVI